MTVGALHDTGWSKTARRVHQILTHRLDINTGGRDQAARVRDRHLTLKTKVAVLFILGNLRLHDTRHEVLEHELVLDGEALNAGLVIPTVRVDDRSARPLLVGLELTVVVTLGVAVKGQGQLRIRRRNGHLLGRRHGFHLVRRNIVRRRFARDDFVL